jgi:hypothetical protein
MFVNNKSLILILSIFFICFFHHTSYVYASEYKTIQTLDNTDVVTSLPSYIGMLNQKYSEDNGTRLYILPKASVTTGVGGTLKIFADPYYLQTASGNFNYRDLGIYFYQDQKNDKGSNGNGVFWINSKATGKYYGRNPDIAFSFQDGATTSARMSYIQENGIPRSVFAIGEGLPQIFQKSKTIKLEMHGDIGLRNNDMIRWVSSTGQADTGIRLESGNILNTIIKGSSVYKTLINQNGKAQINLNAAFNFKTGNVSNQSILSVDGANIFTINNSKYSIINKIINGSEGQEITLIFENGKTVIKNTDKIKLKNAKDFKSTENDTLKLACNGKAWYETSRSLN